MDRICIGQSNLLFLFRYPLQNVRKLNMVKEILDNNPNLEGEEIERLY